MSRERLPHPQDRYDLRGLKVSPFCLGITQIEDLTHAFSHGFNFFFLSADMHWPLYEGTRRALARLLASGVPRSEIVVACVSYVAQPEFSFAPFAEVVEAVPGLSHLDVAVMGGVYENNFLVRQSMYRNHREQRFQGITAMGASFHDREMVRTAMENHLVDISFLRYNAEHMGAEVDVFPFVPQSSPKPLLYSFKSVSAYVPESVLASIGLPKEKWRPEVTDHYRFVLSRPEVDGVLCALTSNDEIDALIAALGRGPLTEEENEYLKGLSALASGRAQLEG